MRGGQPTKVEYFDFWGVLDTMSGVIFGMDFKCFSPEQEAN